MVRCNMRSDQTVERKQQSSEVQLVKRGSVSHELDSHDLRTRKCGFLSRSSSGDDDDDDLPHMKRGGILLCVSILLCVCGDSFPI